MDSGYGGKGSTQDLSAERPGNSAPHPSLLDGRFPGLKALPCDERIHRVKTRRFYRRSAVVEQASPEARVCQSRAELFDSQKVSRLCRRSAVAERNSRNDREAEF
jgi:hypothetical protein